MIGLSAEQQESLTTPRGNSAELRRRTGAGSPLGGADTPSTICSESPVNVEPENDYVDQRPATDKEQKVEDMGFVQKLEENVDAEHSGERKWWLGSDAERKEDVEEEDAEEEEEAEDAEEEIDQGKETDGIETIWRLSAGAIRQGLQSSTTGQGEPSSNRQSTGTATHEGQGRSVTIAGEGRSKAIDLDLGEDDGSLTHLDETLQFLRDTKTPRLPTRSTRMTNRFQDAGSPHGSRSQGTSLNVSEDAKRPSVTASEPGYRLHDDEHSFGVGSSLPLDLNSVLEKWTGVGAGNIHESKDPNAKIISHTNAKVSNFPLNSSTDGRNSKTVRLDRPPADPIPANPIPADVLQPNQNSSLTHRLGLGYGDGSFNSSLKERRQEVTNHSIKTPDVSQNSHSSDDIDSLISRYHNLRSQQSADPLALSSAGEYHPRVALGASNADASDRGDTGLQLSRRSYNEEDDLHVSLSRFDSARPRDSAFGRDFTSEAAVEDLGKENFDDVRCLLLETSLTAPTPNARSTKRLSTSLTAVNSRSANRLSMSFHLAPSPLTDAVHSTEVSFAKLDESSMNLLGRNRVCFSNCLICLIAKQCSPFQGRPSPQRP